uniref:Ionotropic glutamate receptor C-terminal domain-containing protein n=1 Tax=Stomoxys calcitrans TaxID=35570 RepID=A0A1I8NZJ5_STOCA
MMHRTKHKYFNNKIKMLLLILMWALMWHQPAFYGGASSTYDEDSNVSVYAATATATASADAKAVVIAVDDDDVGKGSTAANGSDMINEHSDSKSTRRMSTATNSAFEDNDEDDDNAAIYGHINENDNKSYKLPQNVLNAQRKERPAKAKATSPSVQALREEESEPGQDRLNETKFADVSGDGNIKGIACTHDARPENKGLPETTNECATEQATKNKPGEKELQKEKDHSLFTIQSEMIRDFALRYKKIPRINLFTCKDPPCVGLECSDKRANIWRKTQKYRQTLKLLEHLFSQNNAHDDLPNKSLLLKVVHIDHLQPKSRSNSKTLNRRGQNDRANVRNMGVATSPNAASNPNWLDQVLQGEYYRQIVVVDLSCGQASRRLLELASNKALFNSVYHWLLMEDYAFNRQTEIDDADDMKNKMSTGCSNTNGSSTTGSNSSNDTDKEVVNDSNDESNGSKSAMLVKELFFSSTTTDVVGAPVSGLAKLNKRQPAKASTSGRGGGGGGGGGGRGDAAKSSAISGSGPVAQADEDDMEIIEKFLEKLNININTELILAKRRMPQSIMMPSVASSTSCSATATATATATDDYNTLQKMDYYILYDVWNPGRQYGGELNISKVGYFSHNQGLQLAEWYSTKSFVLRRMNMHLANIKCQIVIIHKSNTTTLHDYLTNRKDTHLDSMHRFNFALLSHVRDLFNFSFILSKTSSWGYLKNGKFDGMIGALVRKQVDIGGSPIFFRIERAKVIDYTTSTWVARPCFIFRHPRSTKKDRIVFLQPFSNDVWILLAACGFVTILLLWLLTTLEPEERSISVISAKLIPGGNFKRRLVRWSGLLCGYDVRHDARATQRVGLFLESILFYVGSICQQGLTFATRSFAGRCIVTTSLLFSFAIYQFYSASIVGTLLMEKPKTIRTLRDLIHSSLDIGIEDIPYTRDFFLRTRDPDAKELYAKKITNVPTNNGTEFGDSPQDNFVLPTPASQVPLTDKQKAKAYRDILHSHESGAHAKSNDASNWYEPEFGVAKIKKGHFAFHVDVATAYKLMGESFTEKEICDLMEIQLFPPGKMVSIVQKGSPLRKPISYGLRRLTEVGIWDYQHKIWHSSKPRCVKQIHAEDLQVDMQTFTSALFVLLFGFLISGLILSLEKIHHRMWQRYTEKN